MAYRLRWQISVDYVPPGLGLGQNNLAGPGEVGGPAQTLTIFGSQGASTPTSTTFTGSDITNMLTTLTTDASTQLNAVATRVTNFASGGG
jgi:hypothetical protein